MKGEKVKNFLMGLAIVGLIIAGIWLWDWSTNSEAGADTLRPTTTRDLESLGYD